MNESAQYIYLDSQAEREQLIGEIAAVRRAVLDIVRSLPETDWYTPRYHGWTPAAMLGHLNLMDSLYMMLLNSALIGLRPRFSTGNLTRFNNLIARIYARRLVSTSMRNTQKNEQRIAACIRRLPVSRFSRHVFHPALQQTLTVEQALQAFFLHHWQGHLKTMHEVDRIQQPPEQLDNGVSG